MRVWALLGPLRSTSSAVGNAPVSPVSPDPLGLAGTVVKVDIDAREVGPPDVDTTDEGEHSQSCTLHLPWPRALPASGLLVGLIKPPLRYPRHWGPGRMVEQEGGEVRKATA